MEACAVGSLGVFSISGAAEGHSTAPSETYQTAIHARTLTVYTHTSVFTIDSRLIFFLRYGQTNNETTTAVMTAQPSEIHSVPHQGIQLKPSTVYTRHGKFKVYTLHSFHILVCEILKVFVTIRWILGVGLERHYAISFNYF